MIAPDQTLSGLQKRDEILKQAFQYQSALLTHAFVLLRNWALAEAVVQETFLVVMRKWEEARPEAGLFPWLRQIVHFKAMEALRAAGRESTLEEQELLAAAERTSTRRACSGTNGYGRRCAPAWSDWMNRRSVC